MQQSSLVVKGCYGGEEGTQTPPPDVKKEPQTLLLCFQNETGQF